jgi:hypothetical protein
MAPKERKTPENHAPTFRKTMGVNVAKLAYVDTMIQNTNQNADLIKGGKGGFTVAFTRIVTYQDHNQENPKPVKFDPNDPNIKA